MELPLYERRKIMLICIRQRLKGARHAIQRMGVHGREADAEVARVYYYSKSFSDFYFSKLPDTTEVRDTIASIGQDLGWTHEEIEEVMAEIME